MTWIPSVNTKSMKENKDVKEELRILRKSVMLNVKKRLKNGSHVNSIVKRKRSVNLNVKKINLKNARN